MCDACALVLGGCTAPLSDLLVCCVPTNGKCLERLRIPILPAPLPPLNLSLAGILCSLLLLNA